MGVSPGRAHARASPACSLSLVPPPSVPLSLTAPDVAGGGAAAIFARRAVSLIVAETTPPPDPSVSIRPVKPSAAFARRTWTIGRISSTRPSWPSKPSATMVRAGAGQGGSPEASRGGWGWPYVYMHVYVFGWRRAEKGPARGGGREGERLQNGGAGRLGGGGRTQNGGGARAAGRVDLAPQAAERRKGANPLAS